MKILQVHSKYKKRGGEETVIEEEKALLENHGHVVIQFIKENAETDDYGVLGLTKLSLTQRRNKMAVNQVAALIAKEKPDICHVHNVYPLISPAVYQACQQPGIPVVQTLHNYKMLCTNSLFFRKGDICELCLNRSLMHSVRYSCYKNSLLATAVQADAIEYHRRKGTWENMVDVYVCLTEFQKNKMVEGGMPPEKLRVKPNFVHKTLLSSTYEEFFLFVGRLDQPKGLVDLLELIETCIHSRFVLIGDSENPEIFSGFEHVDYLGPQSRDIVLDYMSRCKAVIFPSRYYEGMPMVILEAFSLQKGVIARDVGAMSSMIRHGVNGLSYQDTNGLIEAVRELEKDGELVRKTGKGAFYDFENIYSVEQGYENLISLYNSVLDEKNRV
jgi:glycosyltransferase involved in cell wall biosynthesis